MFQKIVNHVWETMMREVMGKDQTLGLGCIQETASSLLFWGLFPFLHLPVVVAHFSVRVIVVHFVVAAGLVAAEDAEGVADVARGGGHGGGVGSCDAT